MALRKALDLEMETLQKAGGPYPARLRASDSTGIQLTALVAAMDSLGCAVTEIEVFVPQLQSAAFDVLKQWAQHLSQQLTYLLEQLAPLEFDESGGQVLIRSTRPDQLPDGTQYYEIILSQHGAGNFLFRRYMATKGQPGRVPVDMILTRQVMLKLVDDLEATIP